MPNKLGVNSLSAWGYIDARYKSGTAYGDIWNASLDRIDWAYQKMHEAGIGYVREALRTWAYLDADNTQWTESTLAALDWSAIDRIFYNIQKYNMHLYLTCLWWDETSIDKTLTVQQTIDYKIKPIGEYIAKRYASYKDYFSLEVTNEINATFLNNELADTWADAWSRGYLDPRWMDFQQEFYNAVKRGSPDVKVDLVSMAHHTGMETWTNMVGAVDQLYNAGKINSFDGDVFVHLYPDDSKIISGGYGTGHLVGGGGFLDVTTILSKLNTYKPGTKVSVGEFGMFWGDAEGTAQTATVQQDADAIVNMYNLCKDNAGVSSCCYWTFWGSSTRREYVNISPGIGMHDMGLFDEVTHEPYATYTAMKNLNLPVEMVYEVYLNTSIPFILNTATVKYSSIPISIYSDANCTVQDATLGSRTAGQENIIDKYVYNNTTKNIAVQFYDTGETQGLVSYSWDGTTYSDPSAWHILEPGEKHNFKVKVDLRTVNTPQSFIIGKRVRG